MWSYDSDDRLALAPFVGVAAGSDALFVAAPAAHRRQRGQVTVALVASGLFEAAIHVGLRDLVAKAFIDEARARVGLLAAEVPSGRTRRQSPTLYGAIAVAWDALEEPRDPGAFFLRGACDPSNCAGHRGH